MPGGGGPRLTPVPLLAMRLAERSSLQMGISVGVGWIWVALVIGEITVFVPVWDLITIMSLIRSDETVGPTQ